MNLVANTGQPHKEVSLVRFDTESPVVSALRCPVAPKYYSSYWYFLEKII